jgi:hypothetical protein
LFREKYKVVQIGLISIAGTSNKALVDQYKCKYNNPKKKHPCHNNKQNKGPKPYPPTSFPNGDVGQNLKVRRLTDIAIFVGKMVMWSLNVLKQ